MSHGISQHLFHEEIYDYTTPLLVIVPEAWHRILDNEKALLAKILASVKLSVDMVTIFAAPKISMEALSKLNPGKVLVFGSSLDGDLKPYETVIVNGVPVLRADALGLLDDAKKKSLWLALKQMFGV